MYAFSGKLSLSPRKLKEMMDEGVPMQIIDLRPVIDHDIVRIEGSVCIPLGEITNRLNEIDKEKTTVLYCRLGVKGRDVTESLRRAMDKKDIYFLRDGLLGWAIDIETDMPKDLI